MYVGTREAVGETVESGKEFTRNGREEETRRMVKAKRELPTRREREREMGNYESRWRKRDKEKGGLRRTARVVGKICSVSDN